MSVPEIALGLIIDTPWIDKILDGEKVWEMRSQHTKTKGVIALIQKRTKCVVGIAHLHESRGPLSLKALEEGSEYHCIPSSSYEAENYRWHYAWQLNDVQRLEVPIPYVHKLGAVVWVKLDCECREQLAIALSTLSNTKTNKASLALVTPENMNEKTLPTIDLTELNEVLTTPQVLEKAQVTSSSISWVNKSNLVPFSKDGSFFCSTLCLYAGGYTVGGKGDEHKYTDYHAALAYLKAMPTAKWRRPNLKGNRGIVVAVEWRDIIVDF